ncbi:MAG: hypothetical protein ABIP89_13755 [Polyangiaceae bacterium]
MRTGSKIGAFLLLAMSACGGTTSADPADAADDAQADAAITIPGDSGPPPEDATTVDAADAGPTRFCDSVVPAPVFCDDFDVGALGKSWDFFLTSPPGTGVLDGTDVRSTPSAFVITTAMVNAAESANLLLRKSVTGTPARVRLAFDVLVPDLPISGAIGIATLDLSTDHLFTLYLRDDSASPAASLVEARPGVSALVRNNFALFAAKAWVHVVLDLKPAQSLGSLSFDGANVLDGIAIDPAVTDPTIRVGVLTYGPANAYVARFDNVTLDYSP